MKTDDKNYYLCGHCGSKNLPGTFKCGYCGRYLVDDSKNLQPEKHIELNRRNEAENKIKIAQYIIITAICWVTLSSLLLLFFFPFLENLMEIEYEEGISSTCSALALAGFVVAAVILFLFLQSKTRPFESILAITVVYIVYTVYWFILLPETLIDSQTIVDVAIVVFLIRGLIGVREMDKLEKGYDLGK